MDRKQRRNLPKEMKEYRSNIQSKIIQTHTLKHKHIIETRSANRVMHSPQGTHTDTNRERGITVCRFQVEEEEGGKENEKNRKSENYFKIKKSSYILSIQIGPSFDEKRGRCQFSIHSSNMKGCL